MLVCYAFMFSFGKRYIKVRTDETSCITYYVVARTRLLRAFSELLICTSMLHRFGLGCIKNGALWPIRNNVPYVPFRNGPKRYPAVPNASNKYSPMTERTRRIEDRRTAPNA